MLRRAQGCAVGGAAGSRRRGRSAGVERAHGAEGAPGKGGEKGARGGGEGVLTLMKSRSAAWSWAQAGVPRLAPVRARHVGHHRARMTRVARCVAGSCTGGAAPPQRQRCPCWRMTVPAARPRGQPGSRACRRAATRVGALQQGTCGDAAGAAHGAPGGGAGRRARGRDARWRMDRQSVGVAARAGGWHGPKAERPRAGITARRGGGRCWVGACGEVHPAAGRPRGRQGDAVREGRAPFREGAVRGTPKGLGAGLGTAAQYWSTAQPPQHGQGPALCARATLSRAAARRRHAAWLRAPRMHVRVRVHACAAAASAP